MALVVDSYRPSYEAVGEAARRGAAAQAYRENLDRSIGRAQEQQQFDAGLAQRYAAMTQAAQQQEADRQFRAEAMQFGAAVQQQQQEAANVEWSRRAFESAEQQKDLVNYRYTAEQERDVRKLREAYAEVDKKLASGEIDERKANYFREALWERQQGIQPLEPRPQAMSDFPEHSLPNGRKVWQVPGRAGAPEFIDQETGRPVSDIYAEQHDLRLAELQNQQKENQQAAQAAVKLSDAQAKAQLEQSKAAVSMQSERAKLASTIAAKKIDAYLKLMGDTNETGGSKFTPEQARKHVEDAFKHFGGTADVEQPAASASQQPPVRVHSKQIEEVAKSYPLGTRFIDENGDVYEKQ
jgi:hypothetical protein